MNNTRTATCTSENLASTSRPSITVPERSEPEEHPHERLAFRITEGNVDNYFFRQGPIAAHVLTTSGIRPRIIVAFPAGNSGAGVWFEPLATTALLTIEGDLEGIERPDGMRGITATIRVSVPRLQVTQAVLGSIRILREHPSLGRVPALVVHRTATGPVVHFHRTSFDGHHHIELTLEPMEGTTVSIDEQGRTTLTAPPGVSVLRMRWTALSDEPPLTPIATKELLKPTVTGDPRDLQALAFLSYREKLLAGSWRFLTYFGRDTLLSVRLLMPVLRPEVIEAGLGSVLERLDPEGNVAHEETIGDYAAYCNLRERARSRDPGQPLYDYKMIDDDFLLAPVLAHYLLDTPEGQERTRSFLTRRTSAGITYAEAVRRNLNLVLLRAEPFAKHPCTATLMALRDSTSVGQWRDSHEGLGWGRIPYDVNVALVPAALHAAERLFATGLFGNDKEVLNRSRCLARAWSRAEEFFQVRISPELAIRQLRAYAQAQGIDPSEAIASIDGTVEFSALALDGDGVPIPVMHSDEGFVLLFHDPSPDRLERIAQRILQPFPAGLRTPVGIVVANPAYAPASVRTYFTCGHYHGTVIWSWQQALLAAGLRRQLERTDLPPTTRAVLARAEEMLWSVIDAVEHMRRSELWSFEVRNGTYQVVPYGHNLGHADESNAVQLWSTVYLALQPPARLRNRPAQDETFHNRTGT